MCVRVRACAAVGARLALDRLAELHAASADHVRDERVDRNAVDVPPSWRPLQIVVDVRSHHSLVLRAVAHALLLIVLALVLALVLDLLVVPVARVEQSIALQPCVIAPRLD
eukprot:3039572-Pleurochrysis_carterae.AAC.3